MFSGVLPAAAVSACLGVRVFFRGVVAVFLLLIAFFEGFLVVVFFAAAFFVTGFFLTVVALPGVLRVLVLATFFLLLRFFVLAGVACIVFLPVVPLMFIQGGPLVALKKRHHSQVGRQIQAASS